ncbi:TPA: hypothetical protein DIC38_02300 [Candidatus Nomurabacteria bacterium]|nr:MAG: FG-GAP repeat-calx-beta protein [Parcubacteria bacterium RAAC4_OD1_1]HCY26485.1 hypothetical protein [Candidatus Nomurabacteria bacterium]
MFKFKNIFLFFFIIITFLLSKNVFAEGLFVNKVDYVTGTSPRSVTTGLFNSDSYLDLAVTNNGSNTVSILLGNGDGTFQSKVDYVTGSGPYSVISGLFNSDLYLDLVVTNYSSNTVSILLGNGDGTFQSKVDYGTGSGPYSVTSGLFNPDSYLDLAVTHLGSYSFSVLLGNGDGTFQSKVDYEIGFISYSIISGLFNSDSYLDLVIANYSNHTVSIFLGNGDGTFGTKVDYATGNNPWFIISGLFNSDSYLDLVTVNQSSNTISILLGNGDGTFGTKVDYVTGNNPNSVTSGLFNFDSYPDLAVTNYFNYTISIFLGNGDGTFGTKVDYVTGNNPNSVISDLFNSDPYPDLVVSNRADNTVSILLSSLSPSLSTNPSSSITPTTVTLNGEITDIGGENPTIRGFEYGLTDSYETTTTENGDFNIGTFSTSLTGLSCETTYHYRSYATNSKGTGYGSDQTFTTSICPTISSVTTGLSSSITPTTVTLNGEIINDGGEVGERGFEYGFTTSYGQVSKETGSYYNGIYSKNITSLTCNTTYHYRAITTNYVGTSYGSDQTFTTSICSSTPYIINVTYDSKTSLTLTYEGTTPSYYIENTTNNTNSDWITIETYQFTGLTCDAEYSFRVKGKGLDNNETDWSETYITILPCPRIQTENGSAMITSQQDFEDGTLTSLDETISSGDLSINSVLVLDFSNWEEKEPLPIARISAGNGVINNKIYIAGGTENWEDLNSTIVYDPSNDSWVELNPMSIARTGAVSVVLNNKLYIIGGRNVNWEGESTMEIYDPSNDSWTVGPSMNIARIGATGGVYNGKIYVAGGSPISSSNPSQTIEVFDGESWSFLEPSPVTKMAGTTSQIINGIMYIAGGQIDGGISFSNELISYNIESNTWQTNLSPIPAPRSGGTSVSIGNLFYYIGGTDEGYETVDDIFVYDITINTWTSYLDALPQAIHRSVVQVVDNNLYIIGGRDTAWSPMVTNYKFPMQGSNSGTFISSVIGASQSVKWETLTKEETKPSGTSILYYTRTGSTVIPDESWSEWVESTGTITSPDNRYIQVKAVLSTTNDSTPTLHSITISYLSDSPVEIITRYKSSGSSASSRYFNLISIGKKQEAEKLKQEFPNQITPITPTITNNPNNTSNPLTLIRTLKYKMQGEDVKELQKYLNIHGYIVSSSGAGSLNNETTYFGNLTKQAVIKFQLANGLVGDGIVGPLTRGKLK